MVLNESETIFGGLQLFQLASSDNRILMRLMIDGTRPSRFFSPSKSLNTISVRLASLPVLWYTFEIWMIRSQVEIVFFLILQLLFNLDNLNSFLHLFYFLEHRGIIWHEISVPLNFRVCVCVRCECILRIWIQTSTLCARMSFFFANK